MTPYAYGVQTDDDFLEERAARCVRGCDGLNGDMRLLCVAECPGFVTADVVSCEAVPSWDDCSMAVRPLPEQEAARRARAEREARVATVVLDGLFSVVRAGFASALKESDEQEDETRESSEKERSSVDRPKRRKGERRRPFRPRQ